MAAAKRTVPTRRRRSAEEAREAILDAAEAAVRADGPAGLRLQEVARVVGVSHPTVLHHFGSRESLLDAVVSRALDRLHFGLLESAVAAPTAENTTMLIELVSATMKDQGRARTLLQLALAGHGRGIGGFRLGPLVEAIHGVRRERWAKQKRRPSAEDTAFTVLLPTLALLSLSVLEELPADPMFDPARFRQWLAALVHQHLDCDD